MTTFGLRFSFLYLFIFIRLLSLVCSLFKLFDLRQQLKQLLFFITNSSISVLVSNPFIFFGVV
eukprot:m.17195 g.17195  ORF g.17195 m.17195 type:complete len:63 (-) comp11029_c0_seq1:158-346(-)